MRPCSRIHDAPESSQKFCRLCWLWLHDERYRAVWSGQPKPNRRKNPCMYLGDVTGEVRQCGSCSGRVSLKVFSCHHPSHQDTTIRGCETCPDYAPKGD